MVHIKKNLSNINDYKKVFDDLITDNGVAGRYKEQITYMPSINKDDILSLLYQAGYLKMDGFWFKAVNHGLNKHLERLL